MYFKIKDNLTHEILKFRHMIDITKDNKLSIESFYRNEYLVKNKYKDYNKSKYNTKLLIKLILNLLKKNYNKRFVCLVRFCVVVL